VTVGNESKPTNPLIHYPTAPLQFSVPIYGGEYTRRGANLDLAMLPLSDAPYLRQAFAAMQGKTPAEQTEALGKIAHWTGALRRPVCGPLGSVCGPW
jgi:hypothetical protein